MKNATATKKPMNSKGAAIFKKMLDDKNAIHQHLVMGANFLI